LLPGSVNWRFNEAIGDEEMELTTLKVNSEEIAAIYTPHGYVALDSFHRGDGGRWPRTLIELIKEGLMDELSEWYRNGGVHKLANMPAIPHKEAVFAPLYRNPGKIWGIGMNYVQDPAELELKNSDDEPVGFMKPSTTLIGPGDSIRLPNDCGTITAEAELTIVIGKECRNISESEAPSVVAGFTMALDITAADIHSRNPRFLTRAKSYDTFFSFGPHLITVDEIPDVLDLNVFTVLNEEKVHRNRIFNMRYRPWFTVAFHSKFMTLLPGDLIMTGTPGPVIIRGGDRVECRIDDFHPLVNPVVG
jgi:2-keto-4-pentenoate hydratase/2-oxohepta-3-ene-1,7-dioic acid hydratase in catechol pathway